MKKSDNKKLFADAVIANTPGLKRFAFSLCKDDHESDELVAETVLKAFENFHRLNDHSKIKQWLFRILNNHFISTWRSKKKFVEMKYSEDDADFSLFEEIAKSNFVDERTPEKNFISTLTRESIQQAIDELPNEFKQSLILCDTEDFSYSEIAVITNVPVGTVRSRIARARTILQKKLWFHAQEMGIKKSKTIKTKKDYTCTCDEGEEIKSSISNPVK
ncbi:MAG TPA: RNA polymerase sigma factor [Chitinophagales bacterium]|nr:RNA polymerase sigma factor [Chitinophagales bacterium]